MFPRFSKGRGVDYHREVIAIGSLLSLCASYPECRFVAGQVLMEEGGRSGVLYVLEAGTLEIQKAGFPINRVSHPGAVFGEICVLLDHPHIATVRALAPTRCRVIHDPIPFLHSNPDAALHLAMVLAQRLAGAMSYLVELKREHHERRDYLSMVDEVLGNLMHLQPTPRALTDLPRAGA